MFGPGKTVNEYKGELATVFQRPGEDILDYMDRVRNLRLAIIDGEKCGFDIIPQDVLDTIDWDTAEAFVRGLPNEVNLRVKIAGYSSLEDAYHQAVRVTHELKRINDRIRYQRPIPPNSFNRNNVHTTNNNNNIGNNRPPRRFVSSPQQPNVPRQNTITCNYCKKPGHLIGDCYKFKARVDAGIIVPYVFGQSGNRARPSREQGEPRRNDVLNRPRIQVATRNPPLIEKTRANTLPPITSKEQPLNTVEKPSCSYMKTRTKKQKNFKAKGKENTRGIDQERSPRVGLRFGRQPLRIISIRLNDPTSTPTVRIVSPDLKTKTSLLLDSGSEINIIKKPALPDSAIINEQEAIEIRGITATSLVSLGQTIIQVAGHPVVFHVVDDSLLIDQDGILGSEFFAGAKARLDYKRKYIKWGNIYIPFDTKEKTIVPKGSSVICLINIANPEMKEGFIPKIEFPININDINTKELSEETEIRKLNDETIGNANPPPNITEILESLNCDKDQTTENKSIAIPIPKTESVSRKVCNKNSKNNSKSTENILKRPIQINNNLNIISTSNENIHPEKVENNQQVVNKVNKEEKRVTEEKNSKHFQVQKTQVERAQRNQEEENRESSVEDLYKNLNKHASHWITIGLKIFYWLLHLVFNLDSINADLVTPLGKYRWYYTILHSKYLWVNIAMTFSKFSILNAISKRLNNWLSDSKLASWRKIKTKMKKKKKIVIGYMVVLKPISQSIAARKGNECVLPARIKPWALDQRSHW
ncbi:uncharacterized protein LOC122577430 [Bombus pyrosoma]|uniref:uncharacterized protein LOC122577430 n=1 Tax=Bombus pyrosoma TaxID=396416 RepID=UPI001CB8F3FC|nr:uncharacterized protein LOC122577430 [Bombus pyrosoma]